MTFDANIDSREAFTATEEMEYNEYFDATEGPMRPIGPPVDIEDEDEDEDEDVDDYDWEMEHDLMLEQQEREDFCECDESYGYYGDEGGW